MSLVLFEGAAGTGKTTRLFEAARQHLHNHPLMEGQQVLALTKFHGSRKRLDARLNGPDGLGTRVSCMTLDGFALAFVRRWRRYVRHIGLIPQQGDFQAITAAASQVIRACAGGWTAAAFPLVLVDEMQDFQGADIELLSALEQHVACIAAADAFQDLSGATDNEAIRWACGVTDAIELTAIHRTTQAGLLDAALALRLGRPISLERSPGFEITSVPSAPSGGGKTSWRIQSWSRFGQIAIISPTGRDRSPFVNNLTTWVSENCARGRGAQTTGPHRIAWEDGDVEAAQRYHDALRLGEGGEELVSCTNLQHLAIAAGIRELEEWARRQRFLRGRDSIAIVEVQAEISEIVRRRRIHLDGRRGGRIALTVHQAKNREFESVIVLWPRQIRNDVEQQRRLLYNAITRARRNAIVIVEDPRVVRVLAPPFNGSR